MTWDAVVVGSGPNGLTAAVVLAMRGRSVLVLEADEHIGGGARSGELTLPGFVHDICSAVHPFAAGSPVFRSLPLEEHGLTFVHPEVALAHPLDGGRASVVWRDEDRTADGMGADAVAWHHLIGKLARDWDRLAPMALGPLLQIPSHPLVLGRFGLPAALPASALGRAAFRTEEARGVFAGCAAHSFLALSRPLTSSFALLLLAAAHAGGWPVARGGSQAISDSLASLLAAHGGRIETSRPVRTMRDIPAARVVLFDVGPRTIADIAGDRLPRHFRSRLRSYRYGPAAFKIDYALDGPVPWTNPDCRVAGTVHVAGTAVETARAEAIVTKGGHPDKPVVLISQQSVADPSRAPAGKHTLWAYTHVPNGSQTDMTDAIERQIERFAPGFRDIVLARRVLSPGWFEQHNSSYVGGNIAGGSNGGLQLALRPVLGRPYRTPDDALFMCSASTPPGGGVHGMAGYHAALVVLEGAFRDGVRSSSLAASAG
ncbi:MAG: FAD-dependent oxidoreductase [Acidimicrobiales bacterium]|nr:FAD-dependent oxidoreductase [Acidimicrobiales bacterium]